MIEAITYLEDLSRLPFYCQLGIKELILSSRDFSRNGTLSINELIYAAKFCKKNKIRPFLQWDILMTQKIFEKKAGQFDKLPSDLFHAVRVQDVGALNYVLNSTGYKVHLILENGNHNFESIEQWCQIAGKRLDRLVLSIELPKEILQQHVKKLEVPVELLGLGPILLFYSPRKLLGHHYGELVNDCLYMEVHDLESARRDFFSSEDLNGTYLYHSKDHCLLSYIKEMVEIGIDYLRLDLRVRSSGDDDRIDLLPQAIDLINDYSEEKMHSFRKRYPRPLVYGFFRANKTDVLFDKIKNIHIQRKDEKYLGHVVDFKKGHYIAILLRNENLKVRRGDKVRFITPEGKQKMVEISFLKDASNRDLSDSNLEDIIMINHITGIPTKTAVYLEAVSKV